MNKEFLKKIDLAVSKGQEWEAYEQDDGDVGLRDGYGRGRLDTCQCMEDREAVKDELKKEAIATAEKLSGVLKVLEYYE